MKIITTQLLKAHIHPRCISRPVLQKKKTFRVVENHCLQCVESIFVNLPQFAKSGLKESLNRFFGIFFTSFWIFWSGIEPFCFCGYFLGGYVPPRTPNWHPVLKKISPKTDTPFQKWANFLYSVLGCNKSTTVRLLTH